MGCLRCGDEGHVVKNCPVERVCYKCGDTGHKAKFCQRKEEILANRECYECGSKQHLARHCPRNSFDKKCMRRPNKDVGKSCFICKSEGHYSKDCSSLKFLQMKMDKFIQLRDEGKQCNPKRYTQLLKACCDCLEYNGAVFLYECMEKENLMNDKCWGMLKRLIATGSDDFSKIENIPKDPRPKKTLRKILKGRRLTEAMDQSTSIFTSIADYLENNQAEVSTMKNRFKLASQLAKNIKSLSSNKARQIVTNLANLKFITQKSKKFSFDFDGIRATGKDEQDPKKTQGNNENTDHNDDMDDTAGVDDTSGMDDIEATDDTKAAASTMRSLDGKVLVRKEKKKKKKKKKKKASNEVQPNLSDTDTEIEQSDAMQVDQYGSGEGENELKQAKKAKKSKKFKEKKGKKRKKTDDSEGDIEEKKRNGKKKRKQEKKKKKRGDSLMMSKPE